LLVPQLSDKALNCGGNCSRCLLPIRLEAANWLFFVHWHNFDFYITYLLGTYQGCQKLLSLVYFCRPWNGKFWYMYIFMAIWFILVPSAYFVVIWYICSHFGLLFQVICGHPAMYMHSYAYCFTSG
jgi:hypothetical protein